MSLLKKEKKSKTEKQSRKDKMIKKEASEQIVRIEELEHLYRNTGTMWIRRHWSACICRTVSGGSSEQPCCSSIGCIYCCWDYWLAVAVLFIAAFAQEKMGNFTINLNRLELYRKGISIADNGNFDGRDRTARREHCAGCDQYFD